MKSVFLILIVMQIVTCLTTGKKGFAYKGPSPDLLKDRLLHPNVSTEIPQFFPPTLMIRTKHFRDMTILRITSEKATQK